MSAKEILTEAAAIVLRGHCKGEFTSFVQGKRCYCALGALGRAGHMLEGTTWHPNYYAAVRTLGALLRTKGLAPVLSPIPFWNDRPERTAEEVAATLLEAAGTL